MKNIFLISALLTLCSISQAKNCKSPQISQYLQEVFISSALVKRVQSKVSINSDSVAQSTEREICYLDGSIATHLDRLSGLASCLSSENKIRLSRVESEQIQIGSYCHTNPFSEIQNLIPKAIFESTEIMATELDQMLVMP